MAFLDDQNKDGDAAAQTSGAQQGQPLTQSAPTVSSGGGGSDVGSGVSTAGVGAGGAGGWTNIQAYLNANQGDDGSAKNLTDAVSNQFGTDKTNMQNQSQSTLNDAQNYVNQSNVSNDTANQWINNAAGAYSWNGTPSSAYTSDVNQAQTALNGQYGGPSSFAYSLDPQSQNYGDALSNDGAFQNLMTNLYSQKAGSPLTSGQAALQGQFDANNQNLATARQQGIAQYGDLQNSRDALNTSTTNQLGADQAQFGTNQNNLRSYLGTQGTAATNQMATDDAAAKAGYQTDWSGTPIRYTGLDGASDLGTAAQVSALRNSASANTPEITGDWGTRLQGSLDKFNATEDSKYLNADDADRKQYNAIQDFLGTVGGRQTQGYKVV